MEDEGTWTKVLSLCFPRVECKIAVRERKREAVHFGSEESVYDAYVAQQPGCHGNLPHLWIMHCGEWKQLPSDPKYFVHYLLVAVQAVFLTVN